MLARHAADAQRDGEILRIGQRCSIDDPGAERARRIE